MGIDIKKFLSICAIALVIFWILSNPGGAAGDVHGILNSLKDIANSLLTFVKTLTG